VASWGRVDRGVVDCPDESVLRYRYRPLGEEAGVSFEQVFEIRSDDRIDWRIDRISESGGSTTREPVVQVPWCRRPINDP
jgi:hypothetical protein